MVGARQVVVLGLIIMSSMYCNGEELIDQGLKHELITHHASALAPVKAPPPTPVKKPPTPAPVKAPPPTPVKKPPPPSPIKAPPPTPVKKPPPPAPVKAPPPTPVKMPPPTAPVKAPPPPAFTIRVAVEGVVYCRSCKLPGYVTSMKASPLPNATALLACMTNNAVTHHGNATSNGRGYFLIQVQNRRPSTLDKCRVILKLPVWCNVAITPKSVRAGIRIKFERIDRVGTSLYVFFAVGFLEYGPARPGMCPRQP